MKSTDRGRVVTPMHVDVILRQSLADLVDEDRSWERKDVCRRPIQGGDASLDELGGAKIVMSGPFEELAWGRLWEKVEVGGRADILSLPVVAHPLVSLAEI